MFEHKLKLIYQLLNLYNILGRPANRILAEKIIKHVEVMLNISDSQTDQQEILKEVLTFWDSALNYPISEESYLPPIALKNQPEKMLTKPIISRAFKAYSKIMATLLEKINTQTTIKLSYDDFKNYLSPLIQQCLAEKEVYLNKIEQQALEQIAIEELRGLGPLTHLLADNSLNDILVNKPNQVYVEQAGTLKPCWLHFRDEQHIIQVVEKIVAMTGKRINYSTPYINTQLKDGTRINVIIPPLAMDSPVISIRKFPEMAITLDSMVLNNNLSIEMATLISIAVKSRLNILVAGATGSGKTTLLNAISDLINDDERIISIENAAELRLSKKHVIRLLTRSESLEGSGAITERHLVKNSLRMRPDRIIVGEVRGDEAFDMIQAMNTGHDGSISTIHANSVEDVPMRLADMISMSSIDINYNAVLNQIKSAIDLIIYIRRISDGSRNITKISEVSHLEDGKIIFKTLADFEYCKNNAGKIEGQFNLHRQNVGFAKKIDRVGLTDLFKNLMG